MNPRTEVLRYFHSEMRRRAEERAKQIRADDIPRVGERTREAALTAPFRLAAHFGESGK